MNLSPLNDLHVQLGARMIDFAGWSMPVMYRSILDEHQHTRQAVSLFDVSHMGRLRFEGEDVEPCLQRLCTRNLAGMAIGQSRYTHVCREDGGVLDDVIVSRDARCWMMVCNASNREKIVQWIERHTAGQRFTLTDTTFETAMVALQGPQAREECARLLPMDLTSVKRYHFISGSYMTFNYIIFHSGYTGEDGFEIVLPARAVSFLVPHLFGESQSGAKTPIKPAGLGARDTLRLEAGMPLYGHELSEEWDSLTAGQGWCVDLEKDFIGAEAMRRRRDEGLRQRIVGLELEGRRTARQHYPVYAGERNVGRITSGGLSPTLGKSIAMALIEVEAADEGHALEVDVHGKRVGARVVKLPFYKRPK